MTAVHATLLAGFAVFLTATALFGCAHGFLVRDPHRWRWLAVFVVLAALTGAGTWYMLGRVDVHVPSALAIGAVLGGLLLYVARRTS